MEVRLSSVRYAYGLISTWRETGVPSKSGSKIVAAIMFVCGLLGAVLLTLSFGAWALPFLGWSWLASFQLFLTMAGSGMALLLIPEYWNKASAYFWIAYSMMTNGSDPTKWFAPFDAYLAAPITASNKAAT